MELMDPLDHATFALVQLVVQVLKVRKVNQVCQVVRVTRVYPAHKDLMAKTVPKLDRVDQLVKEDCLAPGADQVK